MPTPTEAIPLSSGAIELRRIPAGSFQMGSGNALFSEAPLHDVTIGRDFLLGRFPVQQREWAAVMGDDPSAFRHAAGLPVESVSWDAAIEFCARLSAQSGRSVRLPSEAEWEYACRAGTATEYFFGAWGPMTDETEVPAEARTALDDYAWYELNSLDRTAPVGLKRPNPWGLHDMIGTVWEWCADVWHSAYTGAPADGKPYLDGADTQPRRCLRGGAWSMDAFRCRSSYRSFDHRQLGTSKFGLRIAVDI